MDPVCQCSRRRPVVKINGKSSSGNSAGGISLAGTIFPLPFAVGKDSLKIYSLPLLSGASHGYVIAFSFSNLSHVIFLRDSII